MMLAVVYIKLLRRGLSVVREKAYGIFKALASMSEPSKVYVNNSTVEIKRG